MADEQVSATAALDTTDGLVTLLWSRMHSDPDDPAPIEAWEHVQPATRRKFELLADAVRAYLWVEAANHKPIYRPRRWESAHDIPDGTRFRALHDVREFVRIHDHARALAPANDAIKYDLTALDEQFGRRGFVEVV
jgi:hypothetical protein